MGLVFRRSLRAQSLLAESLVVGFGVLQDFSLGVILIFGIRVWVERVRVVLPCRHPFITRRTFWAPCLPKGI